MPRRLIHHLDRLLAARVAVISAPAGHVKDELVAAWLQSQPGLAHRPIRSAEDLAAVADCHPTGELLVLVVSGEELLADATVVSRILELVEADPDIRVIFVGRRRPAAPLGTLAARGQLVDLDGSQLAWTRDEVAAQLAERNPELTQSGLDVIMASTHGWPAVIRILASERLRWPRSAALNRLLDSYIAEEVVAGLDDQDIELLHQLAAPPSLDSQAAAWMTGRSDAVAQLTRLQARGLPLTWDADNSIRLNPVLRDYLQRWLMQHEPHRKDELTARATLWLRSRGRPLAAVELAMEQHLVDLAWRLAAEYLTANLYRPELEHTLPELTELLPPGWEMDSVRAITQGLATPSTMIAQISALDPQLFTQNSTGSLGYASLVLGTLRRAGYPSDIDVSTALQIARDADSIMEDELDLALVAVLRLEHGLWLLHQCRMSESRDVLLSSLGLARVQDVPWAIATALSALAFIHAEQGTVIEATQLADEGLQYSAEAAFTSNAVTEYAVLAKALVAVDTGDLAMAQHWAQQVVEREEHPVETDGLRTHVLAIYHVFREDPRQARHLVRAYRDQPHPPASPFDELVVGMGAFNAALADHDLAAASRELERLMAQPLAERQASLAVPQARLALAQGQPERAHELLHPLVVSHRPLSDHAKYTLFMLMVFGTAADQLHRRDEATQAFQRATVLAERLGLNTPNARHTRIAGTRPKIPLTEAERNVLLSLEPGRTLSETADGLFISLNTLKTHLRRIYKKLGVANREEAIERARILGLRS
ncbi:LuxR C-terminal-related transcriptional regulator [Luteococcus sp. H138]|uniref:LuxR C-terminal-related transcriptional regulator n=1 Tax=unclassified Luteococcus TaxID=2639923 RepID=UPI00313BE9A2